MNCKPGDLAIIIKFSSFFDSRMAARDGENVGRIVKVLTPSITLVDEPCWQVAAIGVPLVCYDWKTPQKPTMVLGIQDSWLRPIGGYAGATDIVEELEITV